MADSNSLVSRLMKTLILTFIGLLIASSAFAKKNQPFIYLDPAATLHIQVMENVALGTIGRRDRFRNFKNTLEEVLREVEFPMGYTIERSAARRIPEGEPRLDLTIMQWGNNGLGQVEARFIASLKSDYNRNKLGIFYYRGGSSIGTDDQITRMYNDVLEKALIKMVTELNERFPVMGVYAEGELATDADQSAGLSDGE